MGAGLAFNASTFHRILSSINSRCHQHSSLLWKLVFLAQLLVVAYLSLVLSTVLLGGGAKYSEFHNTYCQVGNNLFSIAHNSPFHPLSLLSLHRLASLSLSLFLSIPFLSFSFIHLFAVFLFFYLSTYPLILSRYDVSILYSIMLNSLKLA